jgi:hypothetical protein
VVIPTSGLYWSNGTRRTGAHADAGSVDFFTPNDPTMVNVHAGMARELRSEVGELIHEPPAPGQRTPHIHVTRPGVGGVGEILYEIIGEAGDSTYVTGTAPGGEPDRAPFTIPLTLEYEPTTAGMGLLLGLAMVFLILRRP